MAKIVIEVEVANALEEQMVQKDLQKLCGRLKGKGITKLMKMYEDPMKKILVNGFFTANGI